MNIFVKRIFWLTTGITGFWALTLGFVYVTVVREEYNRKEPIVYMPVATVPTPVSAPAAGPIADLIRGGALVAKSDCVACHKLDVKLVGPSFCEIAARYRNDSSALARLVEKVRTGGNGSWGEGFMVPHPTLTTTEITDMVGWILAQKGTTAPLAATVPAVEVNRSGAAPTPPAQ